MTELISDENLLKVLDRAVDPQGRIDTNVIANDPTLSAADRLAAVLAAIDIEKARNV